MERIKTGIKGFDDLVEGGIPKGSSVLLTGPCGAGKLFFASEYLYNSNEPSLFYTFEKDTNYLKDALSLFDWDLEERIKSKQFTVVTSELYQFETFLSDLEDNIDKLSASRVVLDSLTIIGQFFDSPYKMRKGLIEMRNMIKNTGATAIMITETPDNTDKLSAFGSEEFVLDGVIQMHLMRKESEVIRGVSVRKMIGTRIDPAIHPYELTKKGMKIHKVREII